MSTVTKEWLQKAISDYESARDELPFGLDDYQGKILASLRIALASLEAEAVAYIRDGFRADGVHFCGGIITAEEHERTKPALSDRYTWKHQPLYTAPTEPVSVPDESAVELLATDLMKRIDNITGERHNLATLSSLRVSIVEACRAAMLQGAEQTNYRAIVERIAEIVHGKVTDIDLLTVTVKSMKDKLHK